MSFEEPKRPGNPRGSARDSGGVPADPSRPGGLSGGAAAALEFDE